MKPSLLYKVRHHALHPKLLFPPSTQKMYPRNCAVKSPAENCVPPNHVIALWSEIDDGALPVTIRIVPFDDSPASMKQSLHLQANQTYVRMK